MHIPANVHRIVFLLAIAFVSLIAVRLFAQEAEAPPPPAPQQQESAASQAIQQIKNRIPEVVKSVTDKRISKILEVKNADPGAVAKLLGSFAEVTADSGRFIAVSGTEEQVTAAEEALQKIDVPEAAKDIRNVEFRLYVIKASNDASDNQNPLPEILKPLENRMREQFSYKEYRLLDTLLLRSREDGDVEAACVVPLDKDQFLRFQTRLDGIETFTREKDNLVSVAKIVCGGSVESTAPVQDQPHPQPPRIIGRSGSTESGITSQMDMRTGEPILVGKMSVTANGDCLMVALLANVIQL